MTAGNFQLATISEALYRLKKRLTVRLNGEAIFVMALLIFLALFAFTMVNASFKADADFKKKVETAATKEHYVANQQALCNAKTSDGNSDPKRHWIPCTIITNMKKGYYSVHYNYPDNDKPTTGTFNVLDMKTQ